MQETLGGIYPVCACCSAPLGFLRPLFFFFFGGGGGGGACFCVQELNLTSEQVVEFKQAENALEHSQLNELGTDRSSTSIWRILMVLPAQLPQLAQSAVRVLP